MNKIKQPKWTKLNNRNEQIKQPKNEQIKQPKWTKLNNWNEQKLNNRKNEQIKQPKWTN